MKMFSVSKLALAAVALAAVTAAPAAAGTVDVATGTGLNLTIASPVGVNGLYFVGSTKISDVQGLPELAVSSFDAFCVDLQHSISPPVNDATAVLSTMDVWNFMPSTVAGNYAAYLYNTYVGTLGTNATWHAALQLAIWNVLYDTDFFAGSGAFSASGSSAAITQANTYLSGLQANLETAKTADAYWLQLTKDTKDLQDFIGPKATNVPDGGATLALLGGAMLALGVARRRFAK